MTRLRRLRARARNLLRQWRRLCWLSGPSTGPWGHHEWHINRRLARVHARLERADAEWRAAR